MQFKVLETGIGTGGPLVANVNVTDAKELDLHYGDRITITNGRKMAVAIINISHGSAVPRGHLGLFEEVVKKLGVRKNSKVWCHLDERPVSLQYISKKLAGATLTPQELSVIIDDIVKNRLDDIELTYFVAACHLRSMTHGETIALTRAMINTGEILHLNRKIVADKHCTGGVAGNRTTMLIVPIATAAGITMPKTSSRSITSPAGTADTMETLCPVSFTMPKMKAIVEKINGCIVWGGAINLAPADDRIIRVEHPLAIDSRSQLLASIMAKKASVAATHLLVDIPMDPHGKISSKTHAESLKKDFLSLATSLGMKAKVMITDGSHPIGRGLGPQLEARDVLWTLMDEDRAPQDLKFKSLRMAGEILELTGKAKKGNGIHQAEKILASGEAFDKMLEIIRAQGGPRPNPDRLHKARYTIEVNAKMGGKVVSVNNHILSKLARIAGAPMDPGAGVYLHVQHGSNAIKGEPLYTIYSNNETRLGYVEGILKETNGIKIV